jgi:hypothetical protein
MTMPYSRIRWAQGQGHMAITAVFSSPKIGLSIDLPDLHGGALRWAGRNYDLDAIRLGRMIQLQVG